MATEQELDSIVKASKVAVILNPENVSRWFQTLKEYERFLIEERDLWVALGFQGDPLGSFDSVLAQIGRMRSTTTLSEAGSIFEETISALNRSTSRRFAYSDTAEGTFLRALDQGGTRIGAYHAFNDIIENGRLHERDYLRGVLQGMAYRYGSIGGTTANESEHAAFQNLRADIESYRSDLGGFVADLTALQTKWKNDTQAEVADWFGISKEGHARALEEQARTFESSHQDWIAKVRALESSYSEQLKLEAPCQYWADLSAAYYNTGKKWTFLAVLALIAFGVFALVAVYSPPDYMRVEGFSYEKLRAAIVSGALVSIFAYVSALVVRLATSSFHLSRDAKEREQLTLVYLALIKSEAASEADRHTILASLFSRADTGLLKGDSGPAFPVSQVLEKIHK
jgi:hypothetical protein